MGASRGIMWSAAVLFSLIIAGTAAASRSAQLGAQGVPGASHALIRVVYDEWGSWCPCLEDCSNLDSLFIRARPGTRFMPRRLAADWAELRRAQPFEVLGIDARGRVHLRVPKSLAVSGQAAPSARTRAQAIEIGEKPVRVSTNSYDAGLWFDLSVVRRLPRGAVLGYPTGPKQIVRSKLKSADIVMPERSEDRVVTMPADYEGQVRQVIVWATVDSTGELLDATAGRQPDGTSLVTDLDSLAVRAVRGWRFTPGLDCSGRATRSTVGFTVRFGR